MHGGGQQLHSGIQQLHLIIQQLNLKIQLKQQLRQHQSLVYSIVHMKTMVIIRIRQVPALVITTFVQMGTVLITIAPMNWYTIM